MHLTHFEAIMAVLGSLVVAVSMVALACAGSTSKASRPGDA
jgi:hypothetical protein